MPRPTSFPTGRARRRRVARAGALLVLGALVAACSSTGTTSSPPPAGTAGGSTPTTGASSTPGGSTPAGSVAPTTVFDGPIGRPPLTPIADQTSPVGLNGIAFDRDRLWIADYKGAQLLGVDLQTGRIVSRYGKAEGLSSAPDDLAVAGDGTIFWTGFDSGDVGRIRFDVQGTPTFDVVGNVGPGANPIAFDGEGKLYVGRAVTGDGLFEVDPSGATVPRQIVDKVGNVNAFDVAPNGRIYGPRYGPQKTGALVRINPGDGSVEEVTPGLSLPFAAKVTPDGTTAFVAEAGPPAQITKIDLATGTASTFGKVDATLLDNLALTPDGSVYVTLFTGPKIVVLGPDGSVKTTLTVGAG